MARKHRRRETHETAKSTKGKAKVTSFVIDETAESCYSLEILVKKATNPDLLSGAFFPYNGRYKGLYTLYISDGTRLRGRARAIGSPQPSWEHTFEFCFDKNPRNEVLYMEIVEENRLGDEIGSSNGYKVVGSTMIAMPKELGVTMKRWDPLVRIVGGEKKIGGFVQYNLTLWKEEPEVMQFRN